MCQSSDLTAAVYQYERALEINPRFADYLMAHAWADNSAGDTDEASLGMFRDHGLDEAKRDGLRAARGGRYTTGVPNFCACDAAR